jgi:hypothetical protein
MALVISGNRYVTSHRDARSDLTDACTYSMLWCRRVAMQSIDGISPRFNVIVDKLEDTCSTLHA